MAIVLPISLVHLPADVIREREVWRWCIDGGGDGDGSGVGGDGDDSGDSVVNGCGSGGGVKWSLQKIGRQIRKLEIPPISVRVSQCSTQPSQCPSVGLVRFILSPMMLSALRSLINAAQGISTVNEFDHGKEEPDGETGF
ncbi:hypothetical protein PoB_003372600 [Plakobranchus ocellatus]|uniref:Uncharacterized protein n=1 Tax=Plakobranchus ocellatus TaxID=259542 RepID=A0AAV4AFY5_9GAST|nr:hypothetical protein PoB_003372600 [Plakobranchus ocellatus]